MSVYQLSKRKSDRIERKKRIRKRRRKKEIEKHSSGRADIRYGIILTQYDRDEVRHQANKGKHILVEQQSKTISKRIVKIKGKLLRIIWDSEHKNIVTVLS